MTKPSQPGCSRLLSIAVALLLLASAAMAQISSRAKLSIPRADLAAATLDPRLFFGGGWSGNGVATNVVDVYDSTNPASPWSISTLSVARYSLTATSVNGLVLFGGGANIGVVYDTVDIYNASTGRWTVSTLSIGRYDLSSTNLGTKAYFAGGYSTNGQSRVVDVFDSCSGRWSVLQLSTARAGIASAALGQRVFFCGGTGSFGSSVVDILDVNTGTFNVSQLSVSRAYLSAGTVGTKLLVGGGDIQGAGQSTVDIYDSSTQKWTTNTLSAGRSNVVAVSSGQKVLFAGGNNNIFSSNVVDIYDDITGTWSQASLDASVSLLSGTFIGNQVVFGGGLVDRTSTTDTVYFFQPFVVYPQSIEARDVSSIIVMVIAGLVFIGTVVVGVMVVVYRSTSIISNSGFVFLGTIFAGLLLGSSQVFLWTTRPNHANCALRPIFGGLSFFLVMAPILAKLYRFWRIFNNPSMLAVPMGNLELGLHVLVLVSVEVVLLICWTAIPSARVRQGSVSLIDSLGASFTVQNRCVIPDNGVAQWVFIGLQVGYAVIALVLAIALGIATRRIHSKVAWGELRFLSLNTYAWFLLLTFLCLSIGLLRDSLTISMITTTVCILLMCIIPVVLVYGVKLYYAIFRAELFEAGSSTSDFSTNFSPDSIAAAKEE